MSDVIVLGAGPAGLAAALAAAEQGRTCTVLEAAPRVGGMAGSFSVAGQRVDFGSHRLHPATPPPLLELIGELLGSDLQLRPRSGRIHIGGRWVGFPLQATNLIRTLPPRMAANLVVDSLAGTARKLVGRSSDELGPDGRRSFDDEVAARLGRTVADEFYGPFATKLYGLAPTELSAELAERRISASSPTDIARRLLQATRPAGRTFYYPKHGYGQIAERLAEAAADAGATIELSTPVSGVEVDDTGVTVSSESGIHRSSLGLSTIPIGSLASMLIPAPPGRVTEALSEVKTRAMILVYLVLDRPQYTEFDAHYIPGLDTSVARLSEPKNYRDGDDPPDTTVLCAEISCWQTDEIWGWSSDRLADLVVEDLGRVGLPPVDHVHCESTRLGSVYPVYDIETTEARSTIDDWDVSDGRLVTLGRQGLRVIDNLHHVMAMGQGAVQSIDAAGTVDPDRWQRLLTEFAANTVED